jgi:hypothetical protein
MNFKKLGLIILLTLSAFSAGHYLGPKKVEIKEVEKIIYKERETTEEDKKTRSTRRETINPDGTRVVEIIRETDKKTRTDSQVEVDSERTSETKSVNQSQWSVGLYRSTSSYSATIDRRILGGLFIGVHGHSDHTLNNRELGIGLRIEF